MGTILKILVASILVNNYVLGQFLGICPLIGVSNKVETAFGMGMAVTFVITISSAVTWIIQKTLLDTLGLEYLQTIVFILVIATLVQFVEMVLKKMSPNLYNALGVFLPLITTNCVVLGLQLQIYKEYNLLETIFNGLGASLGFLLAIVCLASIREKLEVTEVPKNLEGVPLTLITIGLMSLAFYGFAGLV